MKKGRRAFQAKSIAEGAETAWSTEYKNRWVVGRA
jgi:hypothetical protein